MRRGGIGASVAVVLLLGSTLAVAGATVTGGPTTTSIGSGAPTTAGPGLPAGVASDPSRAPFEIRYELAAPPAPENVTVRATLIVPERARDREVTVGVYESISTVTATDGFVHDGDEYRWDGTTGRPTITVRSAVELHTNGSTWALTRPMQWLYLGRPARESPRYGTTANATRLAVGPDGQLGLLGRPVVTHNETAGLDLTVYEHRDGRYQPGTATAVRQVVRAHRRLDIGGRNDELHVFVRPSARNVPIEGAANRRSLWVTPDDDLAASVLLHEYVHTRQTFRTTDRTAWLVEASAEYYGYREGIRQCAVPYEAFRVLTAPGDDYAGYEGRLTDPRNWSTSRVPYDKGTVVLAALDARIRNATDGRRTLADAVRPLNRGNVTVTHSSFRRSVERTANRSFGGFFATYVAGDELPSYAFSRNPENLGYEDPPCQRFADDEPESKTFVEGLTDLVSAIVEALLGLLPF